MRRLSVSLLFFAGTLTFAQSSSDSPTTLNLKVPTFNTKQLLAQIAKTSGYRINSNFGCPVGFAASRQATGQIMSAGDAKQGPTQALHLTLDNRNTPAIESIEVNLGRCGAGDAVHEEEEKWQEPRKGRCPWGGAEVSGSRFAGLEHACERTFLNYYALDIIQRSERPQHYMFI